MSVAILAAVEKFVRTVRDCLPIDDAPHGEAVAATEMTHAYSGDYCAQRQSHQATFDELLQDPPTDQRPDQAIRLYPEIVPVERDLRALCRLVQGERSKRWEHLQLLLEELQGRAVYSWTWDGYSPLRTGSRGPHHSGHAVMLKVRLLPVPGTLLDNLLQAAGEEERPLHRAKASAQPKSESDPGGEAGEVYSVKELPLSKWAKILGRSYSTLRRQHSRKEIKCFCVSRQLHRLALSAIPSHKRDDHRPRRQR